MPHLTLYDQLRDMPILGAIVGRGGAGRGSEAGGRQGPESSLKVSPSTRDTCGTRPYALCSKWIIQKRHEPPPPPPFKAYGALNKIMFLNFLSIVISRSRNKADRVVSYLLHFSHCL